jgi:delta8-fatty-acid desaturase
MMAKHRIGRVDLPYSNLVPPIRLPDYYINLEKRKAKKEAANGGVSHTDNEKSRRGKSVDLGTVRLFLMPSIRNFCYMLSISTQLIRILRLRFLLAKN